VACACLAVNDAQQHDLYTVGWEKSSAKLKHQTQDFFKCCGYNESTQGQIVGPLGHPTCENVCYIDESVKLFLQNRD